jgi:hypothetical protein
MEGVERLSIKSTTLVVRLLIDIFLCGLVCAYAICIGTCAMVYWAYSFCETNKFGVTSTADGSS